jgi:hypothetical protein
VKDKVISAVSWQDKKLVNILSSSQGLGTKIVERREGHARKETEVPDMILHYNKYMGGSIWRTNVAHIIQLDGKVKSGGNTYFGSVPVCHLSMLTLS